MPLGTVRDIFGGGGSVILHPEPYVAEYPEILNPGHVNVIFGPGYFPPGSLPPGLVSNPILKGDRIPIRINNGSYFK